VEVVAILASGPSMSFEVVERVRAAKLRTFVINDTFRLMPDADALFASDWAWWNVNTDALEFHGEKYVSEDAQIPGVKYVPPEPPRAGGNSALRAAQFCKAQGTKKILLFGVDLNDDQLIHWHGDHPKTLHSPTTATFKRARAAWQVFANNLQGLEVVNCNLESSLTCFPKRSLEEVLG
jgi:hypothetical protein